VERLVNNVSYEHFKQFCIENGRPGAEELTSDFLVFNGNITGGAVNGAINGLGTGIKLNSEYDYYMAQIRASGNFLRCVAASAIGAVPYIPEPELQHVGFNFRADGRTRSLFKFPISMAQMVAGVSIPIDLAAMPAFSGSETLFCDGFNGPPLGNYNPGGAYPAQLDFQVTLQMCLIKTDALRAYHAYLAKMGRQLPPVER
jgi:hypothetical protein